jgi:hypothetical protein
LAIGSLQIPTLLYRLFDGDGVLLYIGISDNLKQPMSMHAAEKPWWPRVANMTVEIWPSREAADAAETAAIRDEQPLFNKAKVRVAPEPRAKAVRKPKVVREPVRWNVDLTDPHSIVEMFGLRHVRLPAEFTDDRARKNALRVVLDAAGFRRQDGPAPARGSYAGTSPRPSASSR